MISFEELAEWIVKNRRGNAFKDYSLLKIVEELTLCSANDALLYVTDESGIVGVACCYNDKENKLLQGWDVLTIKPNVFRKMIDYARNKYLGYTVQVHNRKRQYITIIKP